MTFVECSTCNREVPEAEVESICTFRGSLEEPPEYEPVCVECWETA